MFKNYFFTTLLCMSILFLFITDFFYQYSWMTWYIQFGPVILTWILILIAAAFEKKEDKMETDERRPSKISGRKYMFLFTILLALLIIFMNLFVGQPNMGITDIDNPEFWVFIVVLPLLANFHYRKRTDGV